MWLCQISTSRRGFEVGCCDNEGSVSELTLTKRTCNATPPPYFGLWKLVLPLLLGANSARAYGSGTTFLFRINTRIDP